MVLVAKLSTENWYNSAFLTGYHTAEQLFALKALRVGTIPHNRSKAGISLLLGKYDPHNMILLAYLSIIIQFCPDVYALP